MNCGSHRVQQDSWSLFLLQPLPRTAWSLCSFHYGLVLFSSFFVHNHITLLVPHQILFWDVLVKWSALSKHHGASRIWFGAPNSLCESIACSTQNRNSSPQQEGLMHHGWHTLLVYKYQLLVMVMVWVSVLKAKDRSRRRTEAPVLRWG